MADTRTRTKKLADGTKRSADNIGGAIAIIGTWIANEKLGADMPAEIVAAFTFLITAIAVRIKK